MKRRARNGRRSASLRLRNKTRTRGWWTCTRRIRRANTSWEAWWSSELAAWHAQRHVQDVERSGAALGSDTSATLLLAPDLPPSRRSDRSFPFIHVQVATSACFVRPSVPPRRPIFRLVVRLRLFQLVHVYPAPWTDAFGDLDAPPRTKEEQTGEVARLARALVRRPSRLFRLVSTSFVSTKLRFGRMHLSSRGMSDEAKLHGQRRLLLRIAEARTPHVEPRRGVPCDSIGPHRAPSTSARAFARLDAPLSIARVSAQPLRSCRRVRRGCAPSSQPLHNHHHNVFTTVSGGGGFGLGSSTVGYLLNRGSFRFRKGEAVPLEREEKGNEPELRRHNQRPWPRWRCAMAHVCHVAAIAANARRACERGGRKEDLAWRWWASVEPSDKSS